MGTSGESSQFRTGPGKKDWRVAVGVGKRAERQKTASVHCEEQTGMYLLVGSESGCTEVKAGSKEALAKPESMVMCKDSG